MVKAISYIIPVMLNFVFGTFLFMMIQQLSEAGVSEFIKGLPLTIWAAVYGGLNPLIGKLVTVRNSYRFIIFSGIFVLICALGMSLCDTQNMIFVWMALLGVAFACYCVPFQLFAKGMESGSDSPDANSLCAVGKTAGRYTAAWSIGLACGPLVSGFSRQGGLYACMAIGLLIIVIIGFTAAKLNYNTPETSPAANNAPAENGETLPDLAYLGWIVGGIGTFAVSHIRTRLQPLGLSCGFGEKDLAIMLFSVSAVQSLTALCLSFFKSRWQFRPLPALFAGIAGTAALLVFSSTSFKGCFFPAAAIYGIYSGMLYYYFVFYSLAHPTRASIYAGINETVVSCNSIAAPIIGGALAAISLSYPFLISAILVAGAAALHIFVLRRTRQKFPEAVK